MHLRTGDYNPHFDGGHRDINVYEDFDLVVYLEEIEPEGDIYC